MTSLTIENTVAHTPDLALAQYHFLLTRCAAQLGETEIASVREKLLKGIERDDASFIYKAFTATAGVAGAATTTGSGSTLARDAAVLRALEEKNEKKLAELEDGLKVALETMGESEVSELLVQKADYLAKIGQHGPAVDAYDKALEKAVGAGSKIDLLFGQMRIGFFWNDFKLIQDASAKANELIESGGDWDRRNRLKVYNGYKAIALRQFKEGGELFSQTLSTFTSTELLPYNDFVLLCVLTNSLTLSRTDLKSKIIDAPEVLQVIPEIPHLEQLTNSLYNTEYASFFEALAAIESTHLTRSRLFSAHAAYYVREMRILAYAQLLESYRSLNLSSMARAFHVTEAFLDRDLSRFIAGGRLSATIDKVHGVIETTRPDFRSGQYQQVIKQGDVLLNKLQRLARVINV